MLYLHRCTTHYADCQWWIICFFFQGGSCLAANWMRVTLGQHEDKPLTQQIPLWGSWKTTCTHVGISQEATGHWGDKKDFKRTMEMGLEVSVIRNLMCNGNSFCSNFSQPTMRSVFLVISVLLADPWNKDQALSLQLKQYIFDSNLSLIDTTERQSLNLDCPILLYQSWRICILFPCWADLWSHTIQS